MKRNGHFFFDRAGGVPPDVASGSRKSRLQLLLEKHGAGLRWRARGLLMRELKAQLRGAR